MKSKQIKKSRQHQNQNNRLIVEYNNESNSLENDISQMSNTDAFITVPTQNPQTMPLYQYHKAYLALKHKIVKTLAFLFYKPEEYVLINYLCSVLETKFKVQFGGRIASERYKDQEHRIPIDMELLLTIKKVELSEKFLDAQKNLQALKQSKMIMDKQSDVQQVKINTNFFNMVKSICDALKDTFKKDKQGIQDQKVICKKCRESRLYYQIQSGMKCKCGSDQIINNDTTETRQKKKLLYDQLLKVLKWREQMDELKKKQSERLILEKNKSLENHRVTDIDKDILKANEAIQKKFSELKQFVSPWRNFPIKKNGVHMKIAQSQYAPKRVYNRIKQLQQAKQKRQSKMDIENILL